MKLITLTLLLISTITFSQVPKNLLTTETEFSTLLLDVINNYRQENGLLPLKLDSNMTSACEHHCEYLSIYDEGGHFETTRDSIHLIENIVSPESRAERFGAKLGAGGMIAENCLNAGPMIFKDPAKQKVGDLWIKNIKDGVVDPKLAAQCVLNYWIESPGHNSKLLKKEATFCGVYQKVYINKNGRYRISSTLLLTNRVN
ncbi:SCP_bacterial domain containing protein [uncultured Caudovirales phage]|uniref:SCP_bacterial domain containing protein n=1 Tax=uncultured Caudovirales phage TaxID=2100421 RepID=A0A6J5Q7R3_9CAUD|nr:SCP_bacterial domain containing protein [uncultured Caudovirales phage]